MTVPKAITCRYLANNAADLKAADRQALAVLMESRGWWDTETNRRVIDLLADRSKEQAAAAKAEEKNGKAEKEAEAAKA
jgi:hypothetical protein